MRRRDFLRTAGGAVLGGVLAAPASGAESKRKNGGAGARGAVTVNYAALIADIERLMPPLIVEAKVPGVGAAIVADGKMIWRRGFGVKDASAKAAVDDDTVFEAASVSKTVFAYAALKLCERGMIGLDTPLTRYAAKPFLEGDARLELITPRHVLAHMAGFQNVRSGSEPLRIQFTPGTAFDYSGEGYFYLQSVMSHLAGRVLTAPCGKFEADLEVCATDFDDYLRRTLLAPFGMTASGYVWRESFGKHAARPHDGEMKPLEKKKPDATNVARYGSMGGLHTTATDYAKFLIEVLDPKPKDAFRLDPAMVNEMLRPQIKLPPDQQIDGASSWALGWAVQERKGGNVILHSGGQEGFRSLAMASVERKSGFVLLTNGDGGGKVLYDGKLGEVLNRLLPA